MRLNEICQLNTEDVQTIDGTECFVVTAETIKGVDDKRLKTSSSERIVPVHPALITIGFLDYAAEQRRERHAKLFPDLNIAKTGYYSDNFSKWFRRFLRKCEASAGRSCYHSFRHNFRDALHEARVDREIALALGGWTGDNSEMEAESAEFYGQGYRASTLFDAISKVQYPELDLTQLLPIH
jgi:integrase